MTSKIHHKSSFRDPSGFLYSDGRKLLRQINKSYSENYELLIASGLYDSLCNKGLMIEHHEYEHISERNDDAYKIIEPAIISFISYPYEWSFSQLKDAALLTLKIQEMALQYGMTLKDANAFNIQFQDGKPILIDTLSFEKYLEGRPWDGYRQFCQHFLAPLALMSFTDLRLNQLIKIYLDGIPLDLASRLLPLKTKMNFSIVMHIHLHAKAQKKYQYNSSAGKRIQISKARQFALIHNLTTTVKKLRIKNQKTEWSTYYSRINYDDRSFTHKKEIVSDYIEKINPKTVWDLGANTGEFTKIASNLGVKCIAYDIDPIAVEYNYRQIKKEKNMNIIPLLLDLTNPNPPIGWNNEERMGFKQRPLPDLVMMLALIHHLAISNNLPFQMIARFLSELSEHLIVEFVPRSDSQVVRLLQSRKNIFLDYNEHKFIEEFGKFFNIQGKERISHSERIIYWMKRK